MHINYLPNAKRRIARFAAGTYARYLNCDAIEVPRADLVPRDYAGVMGVPVTWLARHGAGGFGLLGSSKNGQHPGVVVRPIGGRWCADYFAAGGRGHYTPNMRNLVYYDAGGRPRAAFARLFIRRRE